MNLSAELVEPVTPIVRDEALSFGTDLNLLNQRFDAAQPSEIMQFTVDHATNPVVFTNFRPLSIAFLHLVTSIKPDIPVIWVDHGFNTPETYRHIERVIKFLNLKLYTYSPKISAAHYNAVYGGVPALDTPEHDFFSRTVKLEPFNRALQELKPDVWLNGIRHDQNAFRRSLEIFTKGSQGTIRVAPMFHLTKAAVREYVQKNALPDNDDYYDPTKGEEHRECGLLLKK